MFTTPNNARTPTNSPSTSNAPSTPITIQAVPLPDDFSFISDLTANLNLEKSSSTSPILLPMTQSSDYGSGRRPSYSHGNGRTNSASDTSRKLQPILEGDQIELDAEQEEEDGTDQAGQTQDDVMNAPTRHRLYLVNPSISNASSNTTENQHYSQTHIHSNTSTTSVVSPSIAVTDTYAANTSASSTSSTSPDPELGLTGFRKDELLAALWEIRDLLTEQAEHSRSIEYATTTAGPIERGSSTSSRLDNFSGENHPYSRSPRASGSGSSSASLGQGMSQGMGTNTRRSRAPSRCQGPEFDYERCVSGDDDMLGGHHHYSRLGSTTVVENDDLGVHHCYEKELRSPSKHELYLSPAPSLSPSSASSQRSSWDSDAAAGWDTSRGVGGLQFGSATAGKELQRRDQRQREIASRMRRAAENGVQLVLKAFDLLDGPGPVSVAGR